LKPNCISSSSIASAFYRAAATNGNGVAAQDIKRGHNHIRHPGKGRLLGGAGSSPGSPRRDRGAAVSASASAARKSPRISATHRRSAEEAAVTAFLRLRLGELAGESRAA
jgi:hypothetical protein